METRANGEHSPRKRIIAPGAFSHMLQNSYDPGKTANSSNLTVFKILNPGVDPNTPRRHSSTVSVQSPRSDSSSVSNFSTNSSHVNISPKDSPLWNPCNRAPKDFGTPPPIKELSKRPTASRSEQPMDSRSIINSESEARTGRKLLIELEEELIAKTKKLEQVQRVSSAVSENVGCRRKFLLL
jgi:hypothetical protein